MTVRRIMYLLNQPLLVFEPYLLTSIKHACPVTLNYTNCHPKKRKSTPSTTYPQIAPEVRNGSQCQSFASDIILLYSHGRILYKVNDIALTVPCVNSLSLLCLSPVAVKRPGASELENFLSNLFV
jgi:hypothetical protein